MSKPLYVTARFRIKKEKLNEAHDLMQNLITQTLKNEEGCIRYTYLKNNTLDNEFTSYEEWKDAESESMHWETTHIKEALQLLQDMLESEPDVRKWHRI